MINKINNDEKKIAIKKLNKILYLHGIQYGIESGLIFNEDDLQLSFLMKSEQGQYIKHVLEVK